MISIFLDFSKAFDTVDHHVLCQKLNYYEVRGFILDWIKFYFTDRLKYVNIGESYSTTASIKWGVPQGSILAPLLFLIYINVLHKYTELSMVHYADDSTAYESMVPLVNLELEKINNWLCANKLFLNVEKSLFTVFSFRTLTLYP